MTFLEKVKFYIIFTLYIIAYFNLFDYTPFSTLLILFKVAVSSIGVIQFFLYFKSIHNSLKFFLFLFGLIFLISIYSAYESLNQSVLDGIIANENLLFTFGVIPLYLLIRKDMSYLFLLENVLEKFLWLDLLVVFILTAGSITYNFTISTGNIVVVAPDRAPRMLIEFATFWYFFKFLKKGKFKYLVYSLLFIFVFHMYDVQRVVMLATFLTFCLFILFTFNNRYSVFIFIVGLLGFSAALFLASFSDLLAKFSDKFNEAFKIFGDPDSITEAGVKIRISEFEEAMVGFFQRPIFGNGIPRPANEKTLLNGTYFFIADIGIFGILYALGIFGIVAFLIQGINVMIIVIKERFRSSSILFGASLGYLFYNFLKSVPDAGYILLAHNYFIVLMLIVVMQSQIKKNRELFNSGAFYYRLKSKKYKKWVWENFNFY